MRGKRIITLVLAAALMLGMLNGASTNVKAEDTNHAQGKTATASSYESGTTFTADKVVDGDLTTRWGTGQNAAANEWIEVDLGEEKEIRQINIYFERTDEAQNILSYKVETCGADGVYTQRYLKEERAAQAEQIVLPETVTAQKVKVTILEADGGTLNWVNVGICEIEVYSEAQTETESAVVEATEDVNHVRNAAMTASSTEASSLSASKANDGDTSNSSRWSSEASDTANQWLKAEFAGLTKIKQIKITLFTRDVSPTPSQISQFSIKYVDADGNEQYAVEDYENAVSGEGYATNVVIALDDPIIAKSLTICEFVANASSWNNIGIVEVEAYSNEVEESATLEGAVAYIEEHYEDTEIAADVTSLPMPEVEGYTVVINGADFEQIVADDGTIVHPLVDKTVEISYVVTKVSTGETKKTGDITYMIKGVNTQAEDKNTKPVIIPEIAEWYSDSTDTLAVADITKVVYNDASLLTVVDEFIADYADFTGIALEKKQGAAEAGAFNFVKEAPDALLGEEGYTMDILSDRIVVQSESTTGNMYGMQTILQMYKQNAEGFSVGQMRDYPRFEIRGLLLDVARKPISMEMIQYIGRSMRYYKMNDYQIHLSDNHIFLEDYMEDRNDDQLKAFEAYEAFRLESDVTNDEGVSPTAEDYYFTKEEFKNYITSERALGMNIVPEIDVPAHSNSFTKVWPELMVVNGWTQTKRPLIDHLDVSKEETVEKIKEIFDDYTKGDDPTFDSETTVHAGADEFLSNYSAYRSYFNEIVPYIKETNQVRIWGGLTMITGQPDIIPEAIEGVQMNLWSSQWASGIEMYNMGFDLINTIDTYGYIVPDGGMGRGAYGDLLNVNSIFNSFEPNVVSGGGWIRLPSGDDQMKGAAFAIWSDNIDTRASGLSESDYFWRFFDAMPFYAEKTWAATGQEKGTAANLTALANEQGVGPQINPYYEEDKIGDSYADYDFTDGLEDASENNRDLTAGTGASVQNGKLVLNGGESYVTSPIDRIGNGNELSFDIKLDEPAEAGDIIFETDAAYGTHDIRIMEDGKLGFTRELYNYYFDYEIPVGSTVNIRIVAEQQKTTLYVNGGLVGSAVGKFIHNDTVKKDEITNATFALPVERIGSETNAISAKIDNVVMAASIDPYNKAAWTGEADTETIYSDSEGLFEYAFDGNSGTIWHSNWQGASDQLTGENSFTGEIDFGQKYEINQFMFTPRTGSASGYVTKADLFVKANEGDEWIQVAEDQVFAADATTKIFEFPLQEVQFVKFVAKESNDGWVAVSEFDIAKKYVEGETESPEEPDTPVVPTEGYTVALSGDVSVNVGEDAQVELNVTSQEETYNTYHYILTYDPEVLTFKAASDNATVSDDNGTLTVLGYGEDKDITESVILTFTGKAPNGGDVTLIRANIDKAENASTQNAPAADISDAAANITVNGYSVTLSDDFTGPGAVADGEDYIFSAKDPYYVYTFTATMNGDPVTVAANGDGTFVIQNVTGSLVIAAEKTPMSFDVTAAGNGAADIDLSADTAVYLTDYTFALDKKDGYNYQVLVEINGDTYRPMIDADEVTYTISGEDIKGDIVITVTRTEALAGTTQITFTGNGSADVAGDNPAIADNDTDFTFTIVKEAHYDYTVKLVSPSQNLTADSNGVYTITRDKLDGTPLTVQITKVPNMERTVEVSEYVKLQDGQSMFLITASGLLSEGHVFAYDGNAMSYSEGYEAYAYLVISDQSLEEVEEAAEAMITEIAVAQVTISYDGDVNATGRTDVNDAQAAYNMYNAYYNDFATVSMDKFLRADVNQDKALNVLDSAAIIEIIKQ